MKKILPIIVFICCFCFTNEVKAISCLYKGEYEGQTVEFGVSSYSSGKTVFASPLNDFKVGNESKGPSDFWSTSDTLKVKEKGYKAISLDDDCYQYMFYDERWGKNKIYFSNDSSIDKDYDIKLSLMGPYHDSTEYAILEEMACNYVNSDSNPKAGPANFTFKIKHDGKGNGTYEIYDDWDKLYENSFQNYLATVVSTDVIDHFSIRIFWNEETGMYSCPEAILLGVDSTIITNAYGSVTTEKLEIGYDVSHMDDYKDDTTGIFSINYSYLYKYIRENQSSYIKYEQAEEKQGEICNYTRENESGKWYMSLSEFKPPKKDSYFVAYTNETLVSGQRNANTSALPKDIIFDDCENMPVIYTDCLNTENCTVSNKEFSNKDSNGNEMVEKLVTEKWLNTQDATDAKKGMALYTGYKYKVLLCELKDRLNVLSSKALLNKTSKLEIYDYQGQLEGEYNINNIDCSGWQATTNYKCTDDFCKENISYDTEKKILEIQNYCNEMYDGYSKNKTNEAYKGRMHECISFNGFYSSLVSNGIVRSLSGGCEIFSQDMTEKLTFILDLIKIIGPIAALGLGIVDFIKVVANGDADKEMKNAFKRFGIRIAAAALLFLIPVILAFLMDTFLGNQSGYNSDDPFCSIVDWSQL